MLEARFDMLLSSVFELGPIATLEARELLRGRDAWVCV